MFDKPRTYGKKTPEMGVGKTEYKVIRNKNVKIGEVFTLYERFLIPVYAKDEEDNVYEVQERSYLAIPAFESNLDKHAPHVFQKYSTAVSFLELIAITK